MNIVSDRNELHHFLELAAKVSKQYPVVVSRFIEDAKEIEMDAVADHGEIICYAICEHVEFAGVHSGDATMLFPPQKIYVETVRRIKRISRQIAQNLQISGPFNNDVMVIECNLRASRSFPFISKVLRTNFISIATRIMLGLPVTKPDKTLFDIEHVGVKASQFSFSRLQKADPVLGVEMVSTGEVGCIGDNYYEAILTAMLSVGYTIPSKGVLFSSGPARSKMELLESAKMLAEKGLKIYATGGTHDFFNQHDVVSELVHWPDDNQAPNVMDLLRRKEIDLVINIPKNLSKGELSNDYRIRRGAVDFNIPLITNARLASAFIYSICKVDREAVAIKPWQEYF
jgi:carbamoyl-phosphate synthase large subunit